MTSCRYTLLSKRVMCLFIVWIIFFFLFYKQKDLAKELLPHILPWILKGLQDGDDDVRAVAAAALLPVAEELGTAYQEEVSFVL